MKVEGKMVLEIDEERITRVSDGDAWKFEMLKQMTTAATLLEVFSDDHREIRQMIVDNGKTLVKIAAAVGILVSVALGTSVVL